MLGFLSLWVMTNRVDDHISIILYWESTELMGKVILSSLLCTFMATT